MEKQTKKRGKRRKPPDTIEPWRFARAAAAMSAYDEARKKGTKHYFAVQEAVDSVRQLFPDMPISAAEVRRVLSIWRPRDAAVILCFDRSVITEEERNRIRGMLEQVPVLPGQEGLSLPPPANDQTSNSRTVFKIRFAPRPDYPRFNKSQQA